MCIRDSVEEVVTLHRALTVVGGIVAFILNRKEQYPALHARSHGVAAFPEIVQRIDAIVDRFGNVKDNASPGLLEICLLYTSRCVYETGVGLGVLRMGPLDAEVALLAIVGFAFLSRLCLLYTSPSPIIR